MKGLMAVKLLLVILQNMDTVKFTSGMWKEAKCQIQIIEKLSANERTNRIYKNKLFTEEIVYSYEIVRLGDWNIYVIPQLNLVKSQH